MDEVKKNILIHSREKFLKEGFYKISMDEIASDLKISKKTIYKYFSSKENLVEEAVEMHREEIRRNIEGIIKTQDNAIVKIITLMSLVGHFVSKISDRFIVDLQRHLPDIWRQTDEFRTKMITKNITMLINQGKKEGYFIDRPTEMIMTIYVAAIRAIVNPEFIIHNNFSFKQAMEYTFDILINGISTSKGKKEFSNIINRIK